MHMVVQLPLRMVAVPRHQSSEALKDVLNLKYDLKMLLSQDPKAQSLIT